MSTSRKRTRASAPEESADRGKQQRHFAEDGELLGREAQVAEIESFLSEKVESGRGGGLYVCGGTGTGKTASVALARRRVEAVAKRRLRWASVNGSTFNGAPAEVYVALENAFAGRATVADAEAGKRALEKRLRATVNKKNGQVAKSATLYVAIVDEIDRLVRGSDREEVLYQLFEWANRTNSNFCLVGIANAIDLHERFLPRLRKLNLVPQMLVYRAYQKEELKQILEYRMLQESEYVGVVFDSIALELCARKIAAKSGDVRHGLTLCKKAARLAKQQAEQGALEKGEPVRVLLRHVSSVMRPAFESQYVEVIRALPQHAQYALISMVKYQHRLAKLHAQASIENTDKIVTNTNKSSKLAKSDLITLELGYEQYRKLMTEWKLPTIPRDAFGENVISSLIQNSLAVESKGFLGAAASKKKGVTIKLSVKLDDIKYAFKDNAMLRQLLSGKASREYGANLHSNG